MTTYRHDQDESYWSEMNVPEHFAGVPSSTDRCFICGSTGHYSVACRLHPARLRKIRGDECGPGPCTNACRAGDHNGCGFSWCECVCHAMPIT